jgi:hypothetical protein
MARLLRQHRHRAAEELEATEVGHE